MRARGSASGTVRTRERPHVVGQACARARARARRRRSRVATRASATCAARVHAGVGAARRRAPRTGAPPCKRASASSSDALHRALARLDLPAREVGPVVGEVDADAPPSGHRRAGVGTNRIAHRRPRVERRRVPPSGQRPLAGAVARAGRRARRERRAARRRSREHVVRARDRGGNARARLGTPQAARRARRATPAEHARRRRRCVEQAVDAVGLLADLLEEQDRAAQVAARTASRAGARAPSGSRRRAARAPARRERRRAARRRDHGATREHAPRERGRVVAPSRRRARATTGAWRQTRARAPGARREERREIAVADERASGAREPAQIDAVEDARGAVAAAREPDRVDARGRRGSGLRSAARAASSPAR